jgi:UDP-2,3-diacylglucosamine hydrolase
MAQAPVFVLSDAHLGIGPRDGERTLLALIARARREASRLIINGDLFDFWFEWTHVMPRAGYRVIAALADLKESGVPVTLVAGNHDCWGGDLLREDAGIEYLMTPWSGTLHGWRVRVEHGDGLRPKADAPYRRLRAVIRHPLSIAAFRWLHPDVGTWIALRSSHTSRNMRPPDGGAALREVAERTLEADPTLDLYVFGHTHAQALGRVSTGGIYANPGAWLDSPSFLRLTSAAVELCRLEDDGGVQVLERAEKRAR